MFVERTAERTFRVTGSNHFADRQFYSKTIDGVESVRLATAARNDRRDSVKERNRQLKRKRLDFVGANGARLGWGRIDDSRLIDDFMRGDAPSLSLANPPQGWRMALSWLCAALAGLSLIGAIQNAFFPKKGLP